MARAPEDWLDLIDILNEMADRDATEDECLAYFEQLNNVHTEHVLQGTPVTKTTIVAIRPDCLHREPDGRHIMRHLV